MTSGQRRPDEDMLREEEEEDVVFQVGSSFSYIEWSPSDVVLTQCCAVFILTSDFKKLTTLVRLSYNVEGYCCSFWYACLLRFLCFANMARDV